MTFEGTHFEVGDQLGEYWAKRLTTFGQHAYGKKLLRAYPYKKWVSDQCWSKEHACLAQTFDHCFPDLVEELEGMVEGAKRAGYTKACYEGMFKVILGEIDDKGNVLDCSTIAQTGLGRTILAHNEEGDEWCEPLCYAAVRLRTKGAVQEFLSVSYPFQFFGSAVGANSTLAFTGNSIGMGSARKAALRRSICNRVAKTVFSRLMLEQKGLSRVKKLLGRYHAALPAHWYVATSTKIVSVQVRPLESTEGVASGQVNVPFPAVKGVCCHTNHFQVGATDAWLWKKSDQKESEGRLLILSGLVKEAQNGTGARLPIERMESILDTLRIDADRKDATSARIILSLTPSEITLSAFDYVEGRNTGVKRIHANKTGAPHYWL